MRSFITTRETLFCYSINTPLPLGLINNDILLSLLGPNVHVELLPSLSVCRLSVNFSRCNLLLGI